MAKKGYKYLDEIDSPEDLRRLAVPELETLAAEIRDFMVAELSVNPGHFASSFGAVELAIALHYVYDTPEDKVVWDVGHQAYAHKILTGRRECFHTNRKLGGISGFPRMEESPYDAFGAGHASVSISAALGMAQANKLQDIRRNVVAVIGDGALTGGLAYEGLNNAGASNADMLVILNDNNMSISPNVGALKEYLLGITTSKRYNRLKNRVWNAMSGVPRLRRTIQNFGEVVKQSILKQSNLFESLNFRYFGPIDGHDLKSLVRVLGDMRNIPGPKLLHVVTKKGKGYEPAEKNPPIWHAPGKFDPATGTLLASPTADQPARYQDVFGHTLLELARLDKRVVGVTPAMLTGSSMDILQREMPQRCFDVGIAEGHAVTFSAGLAAGGMVPFCNIYSSFIQRAYDHIIHDAVIQQLPVIFCLDRAGLVGEDGVTHHGAFDLAFLRTLPGLTVAAPANEAELRDMMYTALLSGVPFAIRYPRGRGTGADWSGAFRRLETGRGETLRKGEDTVVLAIGTVVNDALQAAARAEKEGISTEVVNMRFAKPLDTALLHDVGKRFRRIVTVEDGTVEGGMGSAVAEFISSHGYGSEIIRLGIPDKFIHHGTIAELKRLCGYDTEGILTAIRRTADKQQ
jgi:1-deoxy-D-xylulose-5-phosphate synthase